MKYFLQYYLRTVLNRINFPEEWRNLSEREFFNRYKVNGMLYCHPNGKLCIASNLDSAIDIIRLT
jgi:uncharacterized UPF0160 family protein